jgi:hypothetical protein
MFRLNKPEHLDLVGLVELAALSFSRIEKFTRLIRNLPDANGTGDTINVDIKDA